jgi:hypothetical protein
MLLRNQVDLQCFIACPAGPDGLGYNISLVYTMTMQITLAMKMRALLGILQTPWRLEILGSKI